MVGQSEIGNFSGEPLACETFYGQQCVNSSFRLAAFESKEILNQNPKSKLD